MGIRTRLRVRYVYVKIFRDVRGQAVRQEDVGIVGVQGLRFRILGLWLGVLGFGIWLSKRYPKHHHLDSSSLFGVSVIFPHQQTHQQTEHDGKHVCRSQLPSEVYMTSAPPISSKMSNASV